MNLSAHQIADFFIAFAHEHGDPLSNLKLQKMLYYAQAWRLALHDRPLFPEAIEAWVHGPVVPEVYRRFKGWAWRPIDEQPPVQVLEDELVGFLTEIMEIFGTKTAYELELLSHQEEPWRQARGPIPMDEQSSAVITHQAMAAFYRSQVNG